MDLSTVAGIGGAAATGVFAVLGWMLKRSVAQMDQKIKDHDESIQKRADELAAYKLHVAEHYATTTELSKAIADLNETLKTLFGKIDGLRDLMDRKADK